MLKRRNIAKAPRKHFTRTADDEFAKFERKERELRQAERAMQVRLPVVAKQTQDHERHDHRSYRLLPLPRSTPGRLK
jgi:hypothetical protein